MKRSSRLILYLLSIASACAWGQSSVVVPNKVSPSAALSKDASQTNGINLGGVLKIESVEDIDFSKPQLIQVDGSKSYAAYLSSNEWNHIALPFVPMGGKSYDDIEMNFINDQSRNIFVRFVRNSPVHLFLESEDGDVVSLQLIPKTVMAQRIVVTMNTTKKAPKRDPNDYVAAVQDIMQAVALGHRPPQFSESLLQYPPIVFNGLYVETQKVYSTNAYTLYAYEVTNPNNKTATLSESEFDGEDVAAVSIFPGPELLSGKAAKVFVLTKNKRDSK